MHKYYPEGDLLISRVRAIVLLDGMQLDDETRYGDIKIVALNYVDGSHKEQQALIRVVDNKCFGSIRNFWRTQNVSRLSTYSIRVPEK